ncbi:MAG: putative lipid II flippase FtsW [Actinomycetes bacterium]|jgi:cell division protein FtsW|nr:putative lipid II flippase FtsW [Actinomycetes bacterium]
MSRKKTEQKASTRGGTAKRRQAGSAAAALPAARYGLLIGVAILLALSLIMAFSASSGEAVINQVTKSAAELTKQGRDPSTAALQIQPFISGFRQLIFIIVGALGAFLISRFDYHKLNPLARGLGWVVIIALFLLLVLGERVLGSTRWYDLGILSIQPSEFAKPILLVVAASFCAVHSLREQGGNLLTRSVWTTLLMVGGSLVLVLLEPDMGSTAILFVGLSVVLVLCEWPWYLPGGLAIVAVAIGALRVTFSNGYASGRLSDFIAKWTRGVTAHQTLQAEYALGSGGVTGLGPGLSRQKFRYLPEAQNDFIIAIIGEELGLIGTGLVLVGFALILFGGMRIASGAKDKLGRAIAGGATVMLVFQAVLNIFAVISLGPVTGKPLPFVTLGGSSMLSSFALVGLILSVARSSAPSSRRAVSGSAERSGSRSSRRSDGDGLSSSLEDRHDDGDAGGHGHRPKRKRGRRHRGRAAVSAKGTGEVDDDGEADEEGDFEWRWDRGAHLSRSRSGD